MKGLFQAACSTVSAPKDLVLAPAEPVAQLVHFCRVAASGVSRDGARPSLQGPTLCCEPHTGRG
eukprot:8179560-Lingulodinium_polyedra.AAC.1